MDQNPVFLDTNLESDDDLKTIWPWVTAAIALAGVVFFTAQTHRSIETSIANDVRQTIAARGVSGVSVDVDGRDVTLSGTVNVSLDKRGFVTTLRSVDGVRVINDELNVFDPEALRQQRSQSFLSELGRIDFSALAFEQGSASLTRSSRPALDALTQLLLQYPEQRVRVSGHTDNTGRPAVNLRISRERAASVAGYMTSRGVSEAQVVARGFGASSPIADNATEAGRARNRRIEISHIQ